MGEHLSKDKGQLYSNAMDGQDRHLHANIHDPPQQGNFRDEQGNMIKPEIVTDYNHHMDFVDTVGRMANSYSISRRT
jgi:hypothetical protein